MRKENGQLFVDDGLDNTDSDEDVVREADLVRSTPNLHDTAPIVIRNLWKVFPPTTYRFFRRSPKPQLENSEKPRRAIRDLSLAVHEGEIFGLLGSNGAGKTTMVSILTGDIPVTCGEAYVAGYGMHRTDSTGVIKARKRIGLCPQVDPLIENMTGRETLRMFGLLRGVTQDKIEEVVRSLLHQLTLAPYADKPCGTYSGGNKRKLSLGVASLVGNGGVLLIDECSTGLDPMARKRLWTLIEELAVQRSVILTTHSMEEAETLCTRIGILARGKFASLGSVQHLKSKFLDGYFIEISCHDSLSDEIINEVANEIQHVLIPGSRVVESHGRFLRFTISRSASVPLGMIFQQLQVLKTERHVVDRYSVSQCSLEQVFLSLAKDANKQAMEVE